MGLLDNTAVREIEAERPRYPAGLLSRQEKDRLIERGVIALYRMYTTTSQKNRNWHPDGSFKWQELRTDHSSEMNTLVEGFYAVEQYVPDYVSKITNLVRRSRGRSNFQIRWGAEEEKHSDAWLNAMLFLRHRSPKWIEQYTYDLRNDEWPLTWDDPLHMSLYAVLQERATQLNYLSTAVIAKGNSEISVFADGRDKDPVLCQVAQTIAIDEAAHYSFLMEIMRLHLYYYPCETIEAFVDVINSFAMPALEFIPDDNFFELTYRSGIFGPREFANDVIQVTFKAMDIKSRKAIVNGVKKSRLVPDPDGNMRQTAIFDSLDYGAIEEKVKKLYSRIEKYEAEVGTAQIDPTEFVPTGLA